MLSRAAMILSVIVSVLCLAPGPASADKLVVFKNGKALKVKTATQDGKWLKCEFEDKNYLSVEASKILSVEEAAIGSTVGELRPNQVVAGGGGGGFNPGPGGIGAAGIPSEVAPQPEEVQQQEEVAAAMAEEQAARNGQLQQQQRGFGSTSGVGRRGTRVGGQPGGVSFGPGGLQPLNQQPASIFQNRSLTQRGATTGNNLSGGPIRRTNPNANQNQPN